MAETRKELIARLRTQGRKDRKDDLPIAVEIVFAEIDDLNKKIAKLNEQVSRHTVEFVASGQIQSSGGGDSFDIPVVGVTAKMEAQVIVSIVGAVARQVIRASCSVDKITVKFDGTHGDDHTVAYLISHR